MTDFDYVRPSSFEEACRLLSRSGGQSKVIAGGTDLLVQIKQGKLHPERVISVRDISELSGISFDSDQGVTIGSMTTLDILESSKEIQENFSAVAEAAGQIGSPQVRSRATIGGNLCNAARGADMAPSLMAYGARVMISDSRHDRTIPLEDFFTGSGQTILTREELLRGIHIPWPLQPSFGTYLKASRTSMGVAMVGVGMVAVFESGSESCRHLRLALGAVAPAPFRASRAENMTTGQKLDDELIDKVSQMAADEARPISDVRCTARYRKELIQVMVRKALVAVRYWAQKGERR